VSSWAVSGGDGPAQSSLPPINDPLITPLGKATYDSAFKVWPVPLSMRSVDAETAVRVTRNAADPNTLTALSTAGSGDASGYDDEDSDL